MIPLKADIPSRTLPFVTLALIALNVGVFVRQALLPAEAREAFVLALAMVPADLASLASAPAGDALRVALTLVTSMFVHGSALHLAGNMLYLWIFGSGIEDVMGHGRFAAFFLLCGILGAVAQVCAAPASRVPLVGASGAIAGVLGAFAVSYPLARVLTLVVLVVFVRIVRLPALIVLLLWLLIQLLNARQVTPGGVAWFAHLGGFTGGLTLLVAFRSRRPRDSLF